MSKANRKAASVIGRQAVDEGHADEKGRERGRRGKEVRRSQSSPKQTTLRASEGQIEKERERGGEKKRTA